MAYSATHMPLGQMRSAILEAKENPIPSGPLTVLEDADYQLVLQSFEVESFIAIVDRYMPIYRASKPLGWHDLAMFSYCLVRSGDTTMACAKTAIACIKKNPLAHGAYLSLGLLNMTQSNVFQAHSYIDLARLAGCNESVKYYTETAGFVDFAWNREAKSSNALRPYILDEKKFKKLEKMYPEAVAHETFMAGVEEVRAHPETYEEICGDNSAFSYLLNWLRRDPCPELFIEVPKDEKIDEMALSSGGSFAQLPQSVITDVASYLTLQEQSLLRQSNEAMNARFGHWSVWRMNYLRWQNISLLISDTDAFYNKVGNLEWRSMCLSQAMVFEALKIIQVSYGHFLVGGPFCYPAITEENREALRKLLDSYHSFSDASWEHPENVMLLHLLDHIALNKSVNFLNKVLREVDLVACLTFMLDHRSAVSLAVCSVAAAVCWVKPQLCPFFTRIGFFNLAKEAVQSEPALASAVWAAGAFSPLVSTGDYPVGIYAIGAVNQAYVERRTIADAESMTSEEILSRTEFTSYGGLQCKSTVSGIYRLFFAYEAPELINDYDSGVIELVQAIPGGIVTGRGIDTFRGRFKVYDARSDSYIDELQGDIKSRHAELHQVVGTVCDTIRLVLVYDNDEAIVLNSVCTVYAHAGSIEQAPSAWRKTTVPKTLDTAKFFGAFCFSFDRKTNAMNAEDREARFQELWKYFETCTTPLKLNPKFGPVCKYERTKLRDIPMKRYPMLDSVFCTGVRNLGYWSQGALYTGNPGTVASTIEVFNSVGDPHEESTLQFVLNACPQLIPTRHPAYESEEQFKQRLSAWHRVATNFCICFITLISTSQEERLLQTSSYLQALGDDHEAVLIELCWWSNLTRLLPTTWVSSPRVLLSLLSFALSIVERRRASSNNIADAAAILRVSKPKPSAGWGVNTFFGSKWRAAITAGSIVLLTVSFGIGAFALGQALSREEKKKKLL